MDVVTQDVYREIAKAFIFVVDHAERIDLYGGKSQNSYKQIDEAKAKWAWDQLDLAMKLIPENERIKSL